MTRILALDVGERRTGVSYTDDGLGFPIGLPTISHTSLQELAREVSSIVKQRDIEHIVLGLPLLPSGSEGEQAEIVRSFGALLYTLGIKDISYIDERYTTPRKPSKHPQGGHREKNPSDPDKTAAIAILDAFLGS